VFAQVVNPAKSGGPTFYQVFVGPDSAFANGDGELQAVSFLPNKQFPAGKKLYARGKLRRLRDGFPDGKRQTILIVEAGTARPWTQPADLRYQAQQPLPKLGGLFKTGFHAAMADGSVRFVRRTVSEKTLRAAITPAGKDKIGRDWND
jgi:hypothetical protein